ncbi:hypothetical protein QMO56_20780 [Roseomonas sp. E05]|uniref:hypothetical protein n=1 Tax=Roseomonas sp. E05 TaxID=3046310 RepID=UPI0024B8B9D1|nr:hypothetical protein [Roseomonas sp. E05]MDJ0390551.1 hypothetical protein [Roseomonas sp. E05]
MSEPLHGFPSFTSTLPGRRLWRGAATLLLDTRRMLRRHRERCRLTEMDARLLRDIGMDRQAAQWEAQKWWWQV